jgi:hypothetical protein
MYTLTAELFAEIAKLSPKDQKLVLAEIGKAEFQRCADDIFYWLEASQHVKTVDYPQGLPYVFTHDPHPMHRCRECGTVVSFHKRDVHLQVTHRIERVDSLNEAQYRAYFEILSPTRPFTIMPYMPAIIQQWLREPLVAIEKSRDMMATWLIVTCYTWDTLFHHGKQNIFQSEDASKTRELVSRANFIAKNQPPFLRDVHKTTWSSGSNRAGELKVPSLNSEILGFPQGPDQIRQYHPSGIFTDETAFQIQAVDSFAAIKPAIQNGGRYTGVSSANPGWFQFICQDTLQYL